MIGMSRTTGQQLSGDDHLAQSCKDILTTKVGTRLCRRNYGSEVPDLIDQPATLATKMRIINASATSLILWEPRLKISQVVVTQDPDIVGKWAIVINGQRTDADQSAVSIPVTIGSAA
jgi:phage baseplate assembly protein W